MSKLYLQTLLKESDVSAKRLGKTVITPNIVLSIICNDPLVCAELQLNNADLQLLGYLLLPSCIAIQKTKKTILSGDVKDLIAGIPRDVSAIDLFLHMMKYRYVNEVINLSGYKKSSSEKTILGKYTTLLHGGNIRPYDKERYQKMTSMLKRHNIMIIGAKGSGRHAFITSFAEYIKDTHKIYSFDLFRYLKIDYHRLFGIIRGISEDMPKDSYLYIPDFFAAFEWAKALQLTDVCLLLEDICRRGNIITQVNKANFGSEEFVKSRDMGFLAMRSSTVTLTELKEILNAKALVYEKFYGVNIEEEDIKALIKEANAHDIVLAQPGRSLKRLMRLALVRYGNRESLMEKPREAKTHFIGQELATFLNAKVIGQKEAVSQIISVLGKVNFISPGVAATFFFEGEIACGRLKTATELAKKLYGEDSLRYIDLALYATFTFKLRLLEDIDQMISSLHGAIIYLDNFNALETDGTDIIAYIRWKLKEIDEDGIAGSCIIIGAATASVRDMSNYTYIIEHFGNLVRFQKLTIRDLERVAEIQMAKVHRILGKENLRDPFTVGSRANTDLNAIGVKKLVTFMAI